MKKKLLSALSLVALLNTSDCLVAMEAGSPPKDSAEAGQSAKDQKKKGYLKDLLVQ